MARASRAYSPSSCSSGAMRGRRKPSGSRSPSRYPHWRKALKMRSRSGLAPLLFSITAVIAVEALDFVVAIFSATRITDAPWCGGDSGWEEQNLNHRGQGEHRVGYGVLEGAALWTGMVSCGLRALMRWMKLCDGSKRCSPSVECGCSLWWTIAAKQRRLG